jgi:anti-sigma regulatory factor (Ser/Thr protein kinase)/DNA-binding NarL/FixJ family response regulator
MTRVLLVGKADAIRSSLERAPLPPDCEIELCGGNVEAVRVLCARHYDVVVTQPSSSVHDSLPLALELQAARPGVRVIVLASAAAPAEIVAALRARVYACFTTPFDHEEIAAITVQALKEGHWRDSIEVVSGLPNWMTLRVSSGRLTAERLVRFMTEYRSDVPEAERDLLMTAFREMLMNAMEHGAGFDPEKVIEVSAAKTSRSIVYHFRDPGDGFKPDTLPDEPMTTHDQLVAHVEAREAAGKRPGGFGMLIVKQVVDEVLYNERGNEVLLIKYLD